MANDRLRVVVAGILGGRMGEVERERDDENSPWTGWAVGTVVPDEVKPSPHDAAAAGDELPRIDTIAAGDELGAVAVGDETLSRIVLDVPDDIDPTVETYVDLEIGGDTQVDIERAHGDFDHEELDDLAEALVAKAGPGTPSPGVRAVSNAHALVTVDAEDDFDDLDDEDDLEDDDGEEDESAEADDGLDDDDFGDDGAIDAAPPVSRKVRPRHRRRDRPRSKTIALKRLTREELRRGALENPPVEGVERPHTRAECRDAPRPCPWVACKHHLYLDINPRTGSIKINFPDLEPWEMQHTCALDVADGGGLTLEEIGVITNLTRERVRQVEVRGLLTLKARSRSLR